MKRSVARFHAPHQFAAEYDDDFYHAVQDMWHLKDWIANDAALGPLGHTIAHESSTIPLLDIIADLANCTKHLVLTKALRAHAELHDNTMERTMTVGLEDGSEYTDVALLDDAHDAWENLLTRHGLLRTLQRAAYSIWRSEDHGGSAEEPQKNHRKGRGDWRQ
jgi:hypothetical protein